MPEGVYLREIDALHETLSDRVIGEEDVKQLLAVALVAEGHMLIEGPVGSGKTLLCSTFAAAIGGELKRVQCTPDMLPADITGFYMYSPDGSSRFIPGPVFTNVLMIDELNRATPRTQSALLETMQERQVTLDGKQHALPVPFMVVASQVPYASEATYMLHASQMDRFMFRAKSRYPNHAEESEILNRFNHIDEARVEVVMSMEQLADLRKLAHDCFVSQPVVDYVVAICQALRHHPDVTGGPSTRGTVALYRAVRALATLEGRDYAIPDDAKRLAVPALAHRLQLRLEANADGVQPETLVQQALESVPVPIGTA